MTACVHNCVDDNEFIDYLHLHAHMYKLRYWSNVPQKNNTCTNNVIIVIHEDFTYHLYHASTLGNI